MKKTLRALSVVLCVILAFSAVTISAGAKSKKYVKSIKVTKKAAVTIPAKSSYTKKSFKVTVKTKGNASKKFTAKSSNGSVASVKVSGKKIIVTAKKAGTAKITVKTKAKNKNKKKLSAKLTLTVKKAKNSSSQNNDPNYVPPKPGTNPGNSANLKASYSKLKEYILYYGSQDKEGDYYVSDTYTTSNEVTFYCKIYYIVNNDEFLFMSCNSEDNYDDYNDYEGYSNYWTSMTLANGGSSSSIAIWSGEKFDYNSSEDTHYEDEDWYYAAGASFNPASFSRNTELTFSLVMGDANDDFINKWGNSDLQNSMIGWKSILKSAGLTFSDLGFNNYS